ncbi:hypothetical protein GCM10010172_46200 [Paractinoplanes ferrugineus]|uniref:Uncharacterized protein n=1 Tax=Paractinoplanes ferrugineus TaxID=113564 RepID=A0A919MQ12_9ACTN|nr:hypothetical protein Afe05nite_76970 [Actinoplanes ferrugineus]
MSTTTPKRNADGLLQAAALEVPRPDQHHDRDLGTRVEAVRLPVSSADGMRATPSTFLVSVDCSPGAVAYLRGRVDVMRLGRQPARNYNSLIEVHNCPKASAGEAAG